MFQKQECVAMLLAGGQGSRLYALTDKTAKPAVGFGGKYKIIDFPLSNCVNSGIYTVGVLTQYQPLVLNEYIGNGGPWDLDRLFGGVTVLPPYQGKKGGDWYKGTANAIYQNLAFIDRYDPDYVLVLSGDHIYKMDYAAMLAAHKKTGADCTIAVITVPIEEASRFGIMNTRPDNSIYEFEEKPKKPKSDNASMGIYIFNRRLLSDYLTADEYTAGSSNDFGKNIIPNLLADGKKMYAYPFSGYWKDVGTIASLWEANMDLLGRSPKFNLHDRNWRIFSRNSTYPPQYVSSEATIENSIITEGCDIRGSVINSILGSGVRVESGAVVKDSVVMSDTVIEDGAVVSYSVIDSESVVGCGAVIGGGSAADGISVVGAGLVISAGRIVPAGAMIGEDNEYMPAVNR